MTCTAPAHTWAPMFNGPQRHTPWQSTDRLHVASAGCRSVSSERGLVTGMGTLRLFHSPQVAAMMLAPLPLRAAGTSCGAIQPVTSPCQTRLASASCNLLCCCVVQPPLDSTSRLWRPLRPVCPAKMASPTRTPSLPGAHHLPQDLIASILPQADRLHLAATCRTLRAASLRWFPEVHAQLTPGDVSAAEALAAWLRRYRARARLTLVKPPQAGAPGADALSAMLRPLAACPAAAGCIASLTAAGGTPGTQLPTHCLAPFRSLECLDFPRNMFRLRGSIEPLWQLHGLRRLRISCWGLAGAWTGMSRLSKLESLRLSEQSTSAVMGALPVLGCLTELGIVHGGEEPVDWSLLTALGRLQSLSLQLETKGNVAAALPTLARTLHDLALTAEDLAAVPPELAACTGLIRLDLSNYPDDAPPVPELAGFEVASLSHLAPLAHLQHLSITLESCCWPTPMCRQSLLPSWPASCLPCPRCAR
ncbi:hypothetical protein ABPG75_007877 [Micractinium tetrahymenae]